MTAIQLGAHGCEKYLKGKRITQHRNESHQELVEEQTCFQHGGWKHYLLNKQKPLRRSKCATLTWQVSERL